VGSVSAQTNWKLEPLLKFPDPVDVHDNPPLQPESDTHSDHQSPSCQEAFLENPKSLLPLNVGRELTTSLSNL